MDTYHRHYAIKIIMLNSLAKKASASNEIKILQELQQEGSIISMIDFEFWRRGK
jgi:hypothetical protein